MLRPRIIPCLLLKQRGLVKTVQFREPRYVGDPLNAVRIFNEKEVDELMVLDIEATAKGTEPDYATIENLAAECRMPFCYGGGIKTVRQAQRIIGLGVEKVAVGSAAVETPELIAEIAQQAGSQSVVVVMDVKTEKSTQSYEVCIRNGTRRTGTSPLELAQWMQELGAGEIVVNSIDRDGTMQGYDLPLIERLRECVSVPLTVLGGAGSLEDIRRLIRRFGVIGAAAGSLFVFKGAYRAVLINYPGRQEKEIMLASDTYIHEWQRG